MAKTKAAKPAKPTKPVKASKAAKPKGKAPKAAKAKPGRKGAKRAGAADHADGNGHSAAADEMPMVTLASEEELQAPAPEASAPEPEPEPVLQQPLTTEWSLPEQFLTVALHEGWDDRMERVKVGRQGAALAASLLLELAIDGRLRIHLDRYDVVGEPTGDPALDAFAAEVAAESGHKAQQALERLGSRVTRLIAPWRGRLHRRGVAREEHWRFLGLFPRSRTLILDAEAKAKLENRLQRTLVGGTPDVRTVLLLALIDSAGLLPEIIPEGALAYNRKRIHALLSGRDPLGYRVDPSIQKVQPALVQSILNDVRTLQGNRDVVVR